MELELYACIGYSDMIESRVRVDALKTSLLSSLYYLYPTDGGVEREVPISILPQTVQRFDNCRGHAVASKMHGAIKAVAE